MNKGILAAAMAAAVGIAVCATVAALWLAGVLSLSILSAPSAPMAGVAERPIDSPAITLSPAQAAELMQADDTLAKILLLPSDFQQTLTLYALLADADRDTLERLLDEADHLQPRREGRAAKSIIYSRYAELDPQAAIDRIMARGVSEQNLLAQVFQAWAKYDHTAALRHAEALPPIYRRAAGAAVLSVSENALPGDRDEIAATFGLRGQLAHMQADEALSGSPAVAWRQALATSPSQQRESSLFHIAHRWAERDPERALAAVGELPTSDMRRSMQRNLVMRWAMTDREAARIWLQAQPRLEEHTAITTGFAAALAQGTPREALDFAQGLSGRGRREAAEAVFGAWMQYDPRAAAEALVALDDRSLTEEAGHIVLYGWSTIDPHAAFEWVSTQQASAQSVWSVEVPLGRIAEHQPLDAMELALDLRTGRSDAVSSVLDVWARNDPRGAAAWLQQSSVQVADHVVSTIARAYVELDMDEALDWLGEQSAEDQGRALYTFAPEMQSLAQASRMLARIDDAEVRNQAIGAIAGTWPAPREAIRWIGRTAARDDVAALQSLVFEQWADVDRDEAASYVRRLGTQAQRDAAYAALASTVLYADNEDDTADFAHRMYKRIRDDATRQETAQTLYWYWKQEHPDRAERYRDDAGLSEEDDAP